MKECLYPKDIEKSWVCAQLTLYQAMYSGKPCRIIRCNDHFHIVEDHGFGFIKAFIHRKNNRDPVPIVWDKNRVQAVWNRAKVFKNTKE